MMRRVGSQVAFPTTKRGENNGESDGNNVSRCKNGQTAVQTLLSLDGSYPSEVAGGLEVDEVILGGVQGAVPVAVVGVVVAHGEGRGLRQAAGGQLCRVVMGGPSALGAVGAGGGETVHRAHLPPPPLTGPVLLHHHHLVRAERGGDTAEAKLTLTAEKR